MPRASYAARRATPYLIHELPTRVHAERSYNMRAFTQDNITNHSGNQYVVYYAEGGKPYIARRSYSYSTGAIGTAWTTADLSLVAGNPLDSPVIEDAHMSIVVGLSSDNRIHVAANMHADPLNYVASVGSTIGSGFAAGTMVGTEETQVTYPTFVKRLDGELLFFYRDGTSGHGDLICNLHTVASGWTRVGKIIDGKVDGLSPYWQHIAVDRTTGRIHIVWSWRETPDEETVFDLCYIYSDDGGVTWNNTAGVAQTLPIANSTHGTAVRFRELPQLTSDLTNNGGCDVDIVGRVHVTYMKVASSGSGLRLNHSYLSNGVWTHVELPSWTNSANRPSVVCAADGRVYTLYRSNTGAGRGMVSVVEVTPGVGRHKEAPLFTYDVHEGEITFDTVAARVRNELHFLITSAATGGAGGQDYSEYFHGDNWKRQWGAVVMINMADLPSVVAKETNVPQIRPVASLTAGEAVTGVLQTTSDELDIGKLLVGEEWKEWFGFMRFRVRGRVSEAGTTLDVTGWEHDDFSDTEVDHGRLQFTTTTDEIKWTPWLRLDKVTELDGVGFLSLKGFKTGAGEGLIDSVSIDFGVIDNA